MFWTLSFSWVVSLGLDCFLLQSCPTCKHVFQYSWTQSYQYHTSWSKTLQVGSWTLTIYGRGTVTSISIIKNLRFSPICLYIHLHTLECLRYCIFCKLVHTPIVESKFGNLTHSGIAYSAYKVLHILHMLRYCIFCRCLRYYIFCICLRYFIIIFFVAESNYEVVITVIINFWFNYVVPLTSYTSFNCATYNFILNMQENAGNWIWISAWSKLDLL